MLLMPTLTFVAKEASPQCCKVDAPGQDGRLSKADMLVDVARDAPESSASGWNGRLGERREVCGTNAASRGYVLRGRGIVPVGRTHPTCAGCCAACAPLPRGYCKILAGATH